MNAKSHLLRVCCRLQYEPFFHPIHNTPDNKVHEAYMGSTWGRQDPCGPHVGPMNLAISDTKWRYTVSFVNVGYMFANFETKYSPITTMPYEISCYIRECIKVPHFNRHTLHLVQNNHIICSQSFIQRCFNPRKSNLVLLCISPLTSGINGIWQV